MHALQGELPDVGKDRGAIVEPLRAELLQIAREAREIDARECEQDISTRGPVPSSLDHLATLLSGLAAKAVAAFDRVLEVDGTADADLDMGHGIPQARSDASTSLEFSLALEEVIESGDSPWKRATDVAFMGRLELCGKRGTLQRLREQARGDLLFEECCSTRRRIIKSTGGVEIVLAEALNESSVFGEFYETEAQRAARIRRAYASFVSRIREVLARRAEIDVHKKVRLCAVIIAKINGSDVYQDLRSEDRRTLRDLQSRLLDWLRFDQTESAGLRVLRDLEAFAELLQGINRRAVLVENDLRVLARLRERVGSNTAPPAWTASIVGRDAALDDLIDSHTPMTDIRWAYAIERVTSNLTR